MIKNYPLFLILIFATLIYTKGISKPFYGHHDWNGAWYSNQAKNYIRYGYLETKLGPVMSFGFMEKEDFQFFTHYPPLLPILISISFRLFGVSEVSARLVPIMFSLTTIASIYFLTKKFFDSKVAILAAAITTVMPIMVYFGKMPVQEVLVLPLVILSVHRYFIFYEKSSRKNLAILFLVLLFSHLTNWPGYYVTPLFATHYLLFKKSKAKIKIAVLFPAFSVVMFALHSVHTAILTGSLTGGGLTETLLFRLNLKDKPTDFTYLEFITRQSRFSAIYFTRPVLFLTAITTVLLAKSLLKKNFSKQVQLLTILGIFGATHNLVFQNMAFIHDYMVIYLVPFLAIASSYAFVNITQKFTRSKWVLTILSLILLLLIILERKNYISTLLQSSNFSEGVILGKLINERSDEKEKVLLLSRDFKLYYEVFTDYYADREIVYEVLPPERWGSAYRLIIAIPTRDTPRETVEVLQKRYQETRMGEFLIFDTTKENVRKISISSNTGL